MAFEAIQSEMDIETKCQNALSSALLEGCKRIALHLTNQQTLHLDTLLNFFKQPSPVTDTHLRRLLVVLLGLPPDCC